MTERLAEICRRIPRGKVFADIGCDHGYCTRYVLSHGLCERAYLSDISAGSLRKAEKLLSRSIAAGKCFAVVADGMQGLPERADVVLIAGLGGEEIVKILEEGYLPEKFVLQPMHNQEKLRAYLMAKGANLMRDYTFADGNYYYDLIAGENAGGKKDYTGEELFFGRENLRSPSPAFYGKWRQEETKLRSYLSRENLSEKSREELASRLERIEALHL